MIPASNDVSSVERGQRDKGSSKGGMIWYKHCTYPQINYILWVEYHFMVNDMRNQAYGLKQVYVRAIQILQ